MQKIKDIYERLHKNPGEYTEIRFLAAQRVFITVAAMYFTSVLFTIGGYYFTWFTLGGINFGLTIKDWSMITYQLYSFLVIATVWFGFSIVEYFVAIYFPKHTWIPYFVLCILFIFGALALFVHLSSLY